jgi:hypothetical protein
MLDLPAARRAAASQPLPEAGRTRSQVLVGRKRASEILFEAAEFSQSLVSHAEGAGVGLQAEGATARSKLNELVWVLVPAPQFQPCVALRS